MFSRIATSALLAGAAGGLIAALLQLVFVQPVLLHAELYESGRLVHFGASAVGGHPDVAGFDLRRDGLSVIFTMLLYTGYALILLPLMAIAEQRGHPLTVRYGLLWGIAGFIVVQLAPGFSLAPEVPGVAAADPALRQIWWVGTVSAAAVALWLIAFTGSRIGWAIGVVLLVAPHLIGAPQPDSFAGPVPPEIAALFAARVFGVGLAGWVMLGCLAALFWRQTASRTETGRARRA